MADNTKVDYDALADAGNRFGQEADRVRNTAGRLGQGTENLKRSGWVGKGADAYYKEWESTILPTYRRLSDALREASNIFKALSKLFKDAEQEASNLVKGTGGGSAGGSVGDAIAAALGGAMAGAFGGAMAGAFGGAMGGASGGGGAGGDYGGGTGDYGGGGGDYGGTGDYGGGQGGDLESFPSTLEGLLKDALGGMGTKKSGTIIEIVLQKGKGMADTGMQYGADQSAGGGGNSGGGGDSGGGGAGTPTEAAKETPSSGGGGGGSDSGAGGGGQSRGASMVEGGAVGQALGSGQAFWFGATPGSSLSSPAAALFSGGAAGPIGQGGGALGMLTSIGATAGAAVLGIVGKSIMGKGLK